MYVLLQVCTYQRNNNKEQNKVHDLMRFPKMFYYNNITEPNINAYKHKQFKNRKRLELSFLQEQCILEFCNSDESSSIDSNARK